MLGNPFYKGVRTMIFFCVVAGDQDIRVFVQEPKTVTASVGEMVRFTCVGIYPQVSYPDVCITLLLYISCHAAAAAVDAAAAAFPGWLAAAGWLLLLFTDSPGTVAAVVVVCMLVIMMVMHYGS